MVELAYREFGNEEAPAIVLVHPFPFDGRSWFDVAERIASHGWRVIVPDLRGCGRTPLGESKPSIDVLASDVAALCERLKLSKPVLGGISLGGYVTMAILRSGAIETSGIILVDTKAGADSDEARENRIRVAAQMRSSDPRAVSLFAEAMLGKLISEHSTTWVKGLVDRLRTWMNETPAETIAWLQDAMATRPDSVDVLKAYSSRALLIRGELDEVCTVADYEVMSEALRDSTMRTIPLVGHLPTGENPEELAHEIVRWVTSAT